MSEQMIEEWQIMTLCGLSNRRAFEQSRPCGLLLALRLSEGFGVTGCAGNDDYFE
jgi:hypothetical protein